jgi:exodeoxyribonuclease V alpha subunit
MISEVHMDLRPYVKPPETLPTEPVLAGTLEKIRFHQDGFLIGVVSDKNGGTTVKGSMLNPSLGLFYTFRGKWVDDPKWGRQFQFEEYQSEFPRSLDAIREYLEEHCSYVGPVIAKRIISAFGEDSLSVLKSDPVRVAREVAGLKLERAEILAAYLRQIERDESLDLDLKDLLTGSRIPKRAVNEIKEKWLHEAPDVIRKNPYVLIEHISGVGFAIADEIAKRLGHDLRSSFRVQAGILHALKEVAWSNGHVCMPRGELVALAAGSKILAIEPKRVDHEIPELLLSDALREEAGWVYLRSLHEDEHYIRTKLDVLLTCQPRVGGRPALDQDPPLMDDQAGAIYRAVEESVFILTGAPGTGKTHTLKALIDSFPNARIELAAPTGKAARRMAEQTGREAMTIHKLLRPMKGGHGGFVFEACEQKPIPADLIILDEVSMLDVTLAASFLRAVSPGTRLFFVGDTNQLPSVGPGRVLDSMIRAGIPAVELTTIKRQDPGQIVINCHRIKAGDDIEANNRSRDFFVLDRKEPESIAATIVELMGDRLPKAQIEGRAIHPLRDVQLITATRKLSDLSANNLNKLLQEKLNPNDPVSWSQFRVGDKVIQLKNEIVEDTLTRAEVAIVNGDLGYVTSLVESPRKAVMVEFENPKRVVRFAATGDESASTRGLDLAYALTVHKFQGSEAPVIVIPIHGCFGPLILQRAWIYTAISRAKHRVILVGNRNETSKIIGRNKQAVRYTRLAELLTK